MRLPFKLLATSICVLVSLPAVGDGLSAYCSATRNGASISLGACTLSAPDVLSGKSVDPLVGQIDHGRVALNDRFIVTTVNPNWRLIFQILRDSGSISYSDTGGTVTALVQLSPDSPGIPGFDQNVFSFDLLVVNFTYEGCPGERED
jgi:hypothetical protein